MLKSWPCSKSLVTIVLPSKAWKAGWVLGGSHFFFWEFPLDSTLFTLDHTSSESESAMRHLLRRISGRIGLQRSSHWAYELYIRLSLLLQLISRFGASGAVGPLFLPLNCCHLEHVMKKISGTWYPTWLLYTMHCTPCKATSYLNMPL